ncbi:MAG: hypothetical protein ACRDRP_08150 [Pseudonocardiaceae bacterium]
MVPIERGCGLVDRVDDDEPTGCGIGSGNDAVHRIVEQLRAEALPVQGDIEGQPRQEIGGGHGDATGHR